MSSIGPSLLVQLPLSSCRAACFGTPARANKAIFSKPASLDVIEEIALRGDLTVEGLAD